MKHKRANAVTGANAGGTSLAISNALGRPHRSVVSLGGVTRMNIIVILFATAQLVVPVLLILLFRWKGILGAFAFTAALHYAFHRICLAHDPEAATAYGAVAFSFIVLALGFVYCLIAIAIAGALSRREQPKT